jgi:hypothetical protein
VFRALNRQSVCEYLPINQLLTLSPYQIKIKSSCNRVRSPHEKCSFGWDDGQKMVMAADDVWEKLITIFFIGLFWRLIKGNPKAKKMAYNLELFSLYYMDKFVHGVIATGDTRKNGWFLSYSNLNMNQNTNWSVFKRITWTSNLETNLNFDHRF